MTMIEYAMVFVGTALLAIALPLFLVLSLEYIEEIYMSGTSAHSFVGKNN